MKNKQLGTSIEDLIKENDLDINDVEEVRYIPILKIKANPDQPRTVFDEKSLNELADSIKEHGVIQPIIVKKVNDSYIIVAGERRVRASIIAGYNTVPAILRNYNSNYLGEIAILENLQRKDLTPIEEALALQKATFKLDLTHEELGKKIGKSRVYVTNVIGLLNLPIKVIEYVNIGLLSMGHARCLSKIKDADDCLRITELTLEKKFTVRQLEKYLRELKNNEIKNRPYDDEINKIKSLYGLKTVKITKKTINLVFDDENELEKVLYILKGDNDE